MEIIFEDNHLLVVNKPAGVLTQPNETFQPNLEEQAKNWIKETYQKPGKVFLEAVHRLDKPVSGIVVFAKTSKALSRLNELMRAKQMRKVYWAWVEGIVEQEKAHLCHFLFHDAYHAKVVPSTYPQGKEARLSYRVLEKRKDQTLVEIELQTGRYHQIRLQFSTIGHPIIGDEKYGSTKHYEREAIALHHRYLDFVHPVKKETMHLEAIPSQSFVNCF